MAPKKKVEKKVEEKDALKPLSPKAVLKQSEVKKNTPKDEEINTKVIEVKRIEKGSAHVRLQTAEGWKRMMKKRGILKK